MNCPYCDESISLAAKFCPKCGLPLKEDATLMGASWGGGEGPNKWLIGAGAAAILAVALSIGWISTHGQSDAATTRRQTVAVTNYPQAGSVSAYPASGVSMAFTPRSATSPFTGSSAPSVFNVTPSGSTYNSGGPAWKPLPPLARVGRTADQLPPTAPEAPRVDITVDRNRWRPAPSVQTSVVVRPEVAAAPMPAPGYGDAFTPVTPQASPLQASPSAPPGWVYDPVQDRWAPPPGYRSGGTRGTVPGGTFNRNNAAPRPAANTGFSAPAFSAPTFSAPAPAETSNVEVAPAGANPAFNNFLGR